MVRLHQILALKALGLPLTRIAALLRDNGTSLDTVLALQERALARETVRIGRALKLVRSARSKLASDQSLSIDDITNHTMETTMTAKPTADELNALFQPITERYFTREELTAHARRAFDQDDISRRWAALIAEAEDLMKKGDPGSQAAMDLARRWRGLVAEFTGGNVAALDKLKSVWTDAFADPGLAPKLPLSRELMQFVHRAEARLKEAEKSAR